MENTRMEEFVHKNHAKAEKIKTIDPGKPRSECCVCVSVFDVLASDGLGVETERGN